MYGGLCHGRARRPLEPHGWVAPLVRTVAWGVAFAAAVAALVSAGAYAVGLSGHIVVWTFLAATVAITLAASLQVVAMAMRPDDLVLPVRTPPGS